MGIKCLHTGDVHIGMEFRTASFARDYGKQRRQEIWDTFFRIIDRAEENQMDFLLIAGDLFEEELCSIGDMKRINEKFKTLTHTRVIMISGNHDYMGTRSLYHLIRWAENVYIIDKTEMTKLEFEDVNTVIWGLSWDKKEIRDQLISGVEIENPQKINILLIHGDIHNRESRYLPIDKEHIKAKGFDYVALGHIHKPQSIAQNVFYCGSPEPLDFGETGEHGIVEGTITKEGSDMAFTSFSQREFVIKEVKIHESMSYRDIIDSIIACDTEERRKQHLYRVRLMGMRDRDVPFHQEQLEKVLKEHFNYLELIDETSLDFDLERLEADNHGNLIGQFIKRMKGMGLEDPIVKDALYEGLDVLLSEKVKGL